MKKFWQRKCEITKKLLNNKNAKHKIDAFLDTSICKQNKPEKLLCLKVRYICENKEEDYIVQFMIAQLYFIGQISQFQQLNIIYKKSMNQVERANRTNKRSSNVKIVVTISIVIMIFQGISNTNLGIINQLTHQKGNDWAGPLSQSLLFLGLAIGSLYNKYIGKYPYNICMCVGTFGKIMFISLGLIFIKVGFNYAVQTAILIASFISGLIVSIFYITEYNYINVCSKIDSQPVKYFAINVGILQGANLFGSMLSYFLIKPLGQFYFVLTMDIIILCIAFVFFFVVKQPSTSHRVQNQQDSDVIRLFQEKVSEYTCVPAFCFTGIMISIIYTALSIIIYRTFENKFTDIELNQLTFNIFIFLGIGNLIAGLLMTSFSQKIKDQSKFIMIFTSLFMFFAAFTYIGSIYQNLIIIVIGGLGMGFCDCLNVILTLSLAGNWMKKGISMYTTTQCLTVAITALLVAFLPFYVYLGWVCLFYLASIGCLVFYRKKIQDLKKQIDNFSLISEEQQGNE